MAIRTCADRNKDVCRFFTPYVGTTIRKFINKYHFSSTSATRWQRFLFTLQPEMFNYLSFGSYKMELNRELSQQSWLEVKLCELDDSYGCCLTIGKSPFITSWML